MKTEFPTLYHKGKSGAIYQWRVWSENEIIYTEYGQVGGAMQIASKIATEKNVGKINATDTTQQASLEAAAMHKFKLTRKYSLTKEDATKQLFLPMLAKDFKDRKAKVKYHLDIQPKLDGCRALISRDENGNIILTSRSGKPYSIPHISGYLRNKLPENVVLDGEIYIHREGFQAISSLVKKHRPGLDGSIRLQYHVYDYIDLNMDGAPWSERSKQLQAFSETILGNEIVHCVSGKSVKNENEITLAHDRFVVEGFEGAILRDLDGFYLFGYRSSDLLKVKNHEDAEFKIVGFGEGVGKFVGCVVWKCVTKEGLSFNVVPKGSLEEKKQLLLEGKKHTGKLLKVKFWGWTDDNKPRFPVGIGFRDVKDLS